MAFFVSQNTGQPALFACGPRTDPRISVTAESGGFKVNTPYNAEFVNQLKMQIPSTGRKWDPASKCWLISEKYRNELKTLIDQCYGGDVVMPTIIGQTPESFEVTFQADYVANCKGEAATVYANGSWSARIPEKVLRSWFKQSENAADASTLYAVLGCDQKSTDLEIKKAFKRAARQWHPDVCREPEARDMFEKVKAASEVLLDPMQRSRYDAGLFFEKLSRTPTRNGRPALSRFASFTPLLRCGLLTVKARRELGMLIVEEILAWEDITNATGQVMVSFWAGESHSVMWV